jgi:hypothetical protein
LARRDGALTVVIGRASLTMKATRVIASALREVLPEIDAIHAVVLQDDLDPLMATGKVASEIPLQVIQVASTRITKERFDDPEVSPVA